MCTYYVSGSVLSALYLSSHLILSTVPKNRVTIVLSLPAVVLVYAICSSIIINNIPLPAHKFPSLDINYLITLPVKITIHSLQIRKLRHREIECLAQSTLVVNVGVGS